MDITAAKRDGFEACAERLVEMMREGTLCTDWKGADDEGFPTPQLQQREDLSDEEYLTDGIERVFRVPLKVWLAARATLAATPE